MAQWPNIHVKVDQDDHDQHDRGRIIINDDTKSSYEGYFFETGNRLGAEPPISCDLQKNIPHKNLDFAILGVVE